jgi:hypothetical protein
LISKGAACAFLTINFRAAGRLIQDGASGIIRCQNETKPETDKRASTLAWLSIDPNADTAASGPKIDFKRSDQRFPYNQFLRSGPPMVSPWCAQAKVFQLAHMKQSPGLNYSPCDFRGRGGGPIMISPETQDESLAYFIKRKN